MPSSRAIIPNDTIACVLSVRNEARLRYVARKLEEAGAKFVLIEEPDLAGQATAIGIAPCARETVGRALKDCIVYRPDAS